MRGRLPIAVAVFALAACAAEDDASVVTTGDTTTLATTPAPAQDTAAASPGRATLLNAQGDTVGVAELHPAGQGVHISLTVQGLPPGEKGLHFHETGSCEPPAFQSAGSHFAPEGRQHGLENPQGPHAGDLRNLNVGQDGRAQQDFTTDRVSLGRGANSLYDSDGTALMIHAGPDDHRTDPSGNSGDRIACGVVERAG